MKRLLLALTAAASLISASAFAGINGGARLAKRAEALLFVGPVEAVNDKTKTVVVLGQAISLASVAGVELGETLSVFGAAREDGAIEVSAVRRGGLYVAGATPVLLTGVVQGVDSLGRATISGVTVDLTAFLANDEASALEVGAVVQVVGIQPSPRGVLLAQGINGGALSGINGGALSGINGGALSGINGGALSGINGGALSGINGGALSGINGGALSGINGGALSGINGGALSGINGGALSGINGGALSGINGGALSGINGGAR